MHFNAVYFPREMNKGVKQPPGSVAVNCFCVLGVPTATLTELSWCVRGHDKRQAMGLPLGLVSRFVQHSKLCLILSVANIYT